MSSKGPSGAVQGPGVGGEDEEGLHSWSRQTPQPGVWSRKPRSEPYGEAPFPAGQQVCTGTWWGVPRPCFHH